MPIFGYLAIPNKGAFLKLRDDLNALPHCEIIPAENRDVIVLVTDTPNDLEEKTLQEKLHKLDSLQSLSMTFGHNDIPQSDNPER